MPRSAGPLFASVFLVGGLLAACDAGRAGDVPSSSGGLQVSGAWARPAAAGEASAIYLMISNDGAQDDALIAVECEIADECMLHQTTMADDVVHMEHLSRLAIPANSQVVLEPGGAHIMLTGLASELAVGDHVALTLRFESAEEVRIEAAVLAP
jgi:copper(I)-binding protein